MKLAAISMIYFSDFWKEELRLDNLHKNSFIVVNCFYANPLSYEKVSPEICQRQIKQ